MAATAGATPLPLPVPRLATPALLALGMAVPLYFAVLAPAWASRVLARMRPGPARLAASLPLVAATLLIAEPVRGEFGPFAYLCTYFFIGLSASKVQWPQVDVFFSGGGGEGPP